MKLQGFYKIEAVDPDGTRHLLADWFPNLITNGGLNEIGNASGYLANCYLGTGNTAPAFTDTQLAALVGATNTIVGSVGTVQSATPFYGSRVNTYQFSPGVAVGTLAEIGVGPSSTTLFSRALILDADGNPTTLVVGAGQIVDVSYELRLYPPLADITGNRTIDSISYAYTLRAADVGSDAWIPSELGDLGVIHLVDAYGGPIGAIDSHPLGTAAPETSGTDGTYTNGDHFSTRDSFWNATVANFGGVEALLLSMGSSGKLGKLQVGFSPVLPKTSSDSMTLTDKLTWGRTS